MIQRLRARWNRWRSSLWFVPAGMVVVAFVSAIGMIQLPAYVPRALLIRFPRLFGADAQSSRSMLSTIAGSMATIAGVTFSITVVAVAQASSQYTSRILRNFLSDRPSQFMLGRIPEAVDGRQAPRTQAVHRSARPGHAGRPELEMERRHVTPPEAKPEPKPGAPADPNKDDLKTLPMPEMEQLARVHAVYEQLGRKDVDAVREWEKSHPASKTTLAEPETGSDHVTEPVKPA